MWVFLFMALIILGPIIYLIADYILYEVKEIKRKKYYKEEELIHISTYNNKNISNEDIMLTFNTQMIKYKQHYFNIVYELYDKKEDQNYAWTIKTTKQIYGWGVIYHIQLSFSNGWVHLFFSDKIFKSGDDFSLEYYFLGRDYGALYIENTLKTCRDEARMMWKMNGRAPVEYLPFNYIPLSEGGKPSQEKAPQIDLVSFYRNLLGLKFRFSHEELKKSYREAVGKYHPDRYGASSPRDRENAEMLMKQVNEAYEKLRKIAV